MKILLKYHTTSIEAEFNFPIPPVLISINNSENNVDELRIINEAIENPIDKPCLSHILRKGEQTTIIVPDRTRKCNLKFCLPILIQQLKLAGIKKQDITIVIANGTHIAETESEKIDLLGKEIVSGLRVVNHNCKNEDDLVHLGETTRGIPVYINKNVVKAERLILISAVKPHYFAGYGGGPKLICPGCAGFDTIFQNHNLMIDNKIPNLHPECRDGNTVGNPVTEDIWDATKFIQTDFSLQLVLDNNDKIVAAYSGSLTESHNKACELASKLYLIPISNNYDLVISSCGGYPNDINFIQTHKTIQHAFNAVKENGVIIIAAACIQGIGSNSFEEWFQYKTLIQMHNAILENFKINSNTALSLKYKTEKSKIIFISEFEDSKVKKFGMIPAHSLKNALQLASRLLPNRYNTALIPDGALAVPYFKRS